VYQVENIRDGRSFSVRRTQAFQNGKQIFFMSASFHIGEDGLEHGEPAPMEVPAPAEVPTLSERLAAHPDRLGIWTRTPRPIDVRYIGESGFSAMGERPAQPEQRVWMRADGKLPDDPLLHVCVLTYASDLTLLDTVLNQHGQVWGAGGYLGTSLDHALWFHRPFRADEWFLYDSESPSAADGRGLATGRFFTADGVHIASAVQEGLLRRAPAAPPGVP
ncbi:MAG: acyl-CoA thioesterase, partial [Stackebrandtia sp.]